MSVGFVMLAHSALDRAAQVARHLAGEGCPVVIHVDRRVGAKAFAAFEASLASDGDIHLAPRVRCDWGTWSLVEASRSSAALLLERHPELDHVALISGSCVPIRPVSDLISYLARHKGTDFIESVTIRDVPWIKGGLSEERFTFGFPFAWKRQKKLFDLWVEVQRRIGRVRTMPEGLSPHMGSQWWCLSRQTLEPILNDPNRETIDRYFRRVWIPDESYYQTLVRRYDTQVESRSLTLSKFDFQGKPHVFYDDHLLLLRQSSAYFARKIWPDAKRLYRAFLDEGAKRSSPTTAATAAHIDRTFAEAVVRRTCGRAGLVMASRYPRDGYENGLTAAPYAVFHGFSDLFSDFHEWISQTTGTRAHGHLFAKDRAEFADGQTGYAGALPGSAALRDYNPAAFLGNLIWNTRGEHQSFQFSPRDSQGVTDFLSRDANAVISVISGAWALPLLRAGAGVAAVRGEAARLQQIEADFLERLGERRTRAKVNVWTLAEFVERPAEPLQAVLDDLSGPDPRRLTEMPTLLPMAGLAAFLQALRNAGMNPHLAGEIGDGAPSAKSVRRARSVTAHAGRTH